jgi:methanogenic corrinoid protein MtbC1
MCASLMDTVRLIRMSGDHDLISTPIIIGGNHLNEEICRYVGADHWVNDAMSGVRLCQELLQQ